MSAADIAAARARVVETREVLAACHSERESAQRYFDHEEEFEEIANAAMHLSSAEGREARALADNALALSDLLLAMTAPEPAPAEPALPAEVRPWLDKALGQEEPADVAREVKPERVAVLRHDEGWHVYSDGSDDDPDPAWRFPAGAWSDTLNNSFVRGATYNADDGGWRERDDAGAFVALIDWPPAPTPAPESADDKATRIGRELDPKPVVAALEPAPAGPPSLWEWVRAACVSRLGEPTDMHEHALDWHNAGSTYYVAVNCRTPKTWSGWTVYRNGSHYATCTTPAELTAALDALAEEAGRG